MTSHPASEPSSHSIDLNSWGTWAKFIVNETQRFSKEIEGLHTDLKSMSKDNFELKQEIANLKANQNLELTKLELKTDITAQQTHILNNKTELMTSLNSTNSKIKEVVSKLESIQSEVDGFSTFKTQIVTALFLVNTAVVIGVTIYVG